MTQVPGGALVAIPMQGCGGTAEAQTVQPGTQESPAQMVLVPVSETAGYQPSAAIATDYQLEQGGMLSSYGQGQSMTLEKEQV